MPLYAAFDRRHFLAGSAAALALATVRPARAAEDAEAVLITLADLHSPYARLPALLTAIRARSAGRPAAVLINGDIFERGNAVALRSGAALDWTFLATLARDLPVVVNVGNHETAILDDPASFVSRAQGIGIEVISNLVDRGTRRFFAPAATRVGLGGIELAILGTAPTNPFVFRAPVRDRITFLDPAEFVSDAFGDLTGGADLPVLASHSGLIADRAAMEHLPAGALVVGGHDHLTLTHETPGLHYLHNGAWGTTMGVVGLNRSGAGLTVTPRQVAVGLDSGDPALAEAVAATEAAHLQDGDTEVLADLPQSYDIHGSILLATEAVRAATGADLAVLGHTTFGAPLSAGPLRRYDFDAFVRFDGGLAVAEVPGETLAGILARANQFRATDLDARTGDYVHVAEFDIDPGRTYRLATNGWTATNQESYLGTTDLGFEEQGEMRLKAVVAEYLGTL